MAAERYGHFEIAVIIYAVIAVAAAWPSKPCVDPFAGYTTNELRDFILEADDDDVELYAAEIARRAAWTDHREEVAGHRIGRGEAQDWMLEKYQSVGQEELFYEMSPKVADWRVKDRGLLFTLVVRTQNTIAPPRFFSALADEEDAKLDVAQQLRDYKLVLNRLAVDVKRQAPFVGHFRG